MQIIADEGYFFGLGVFTTIAIEQGIPIFLKEHLERMEQSLGYFGIAQTIHPEELQEQLQKHKMDHGVLKITASQENKVFSFRENPYGREQMEKGFSLGYSSVLRNETSPFTYHKTIQYGDCILEKRKALSMAFDDFLFLNTKNEICETTSGNIFFTKGNSVYTPTLSCGMLPGIARGYVCRTYQVEERIIHKEDVCEFDGCFLTNALMGIMPVVKLADYVFSDNHLAMQFIDDYQREVAGIIGTLE